MTAGYSPAMIEQVCSIALMAAHHDGRARLRPHRHPHRHGHRGVGHRRRLRVHARRAAPDRDPRGGPRDRRPRLHGRHARGLAAHDPPALRRLGRPLDGAREGRPLRPLPLRVLQGHAHDDGRARRRARVLRREHERRRRRHVQRRPPGRDHGRPLRHAARAHPDARDDDPQRGGGGAQEARRLLPRHGRQAARRRIARRPLRECR